MPSAIIVGAGLAGLNCARTLQESNFDVTVLEKSNRIGGRVATDYVDGFQFDHGFQVINPAYSELKRLNLTKKLELKELPKGFEIEISQKPYLVGDPRTNLKFLQSDFSFQTGSIKEKLSFLRFILSRPRNETFGRSMISSGNFYTKVLKGFLDGVFLADSNEVSSEMAHELLQWFLKGNPGVPARGVAELPRLLSQDLDIRKYCEVLELRDGFVATNQENYRADVIVIAADPQSTQKLLQRPPLQMNASWTWYHAVDSQAIQSKYLKVLHKDPLLNTVAISNIAHKYAPQGSTLISSTTLMKLTESQATQAVAQAWQLSPSDLLFLRRYEIRDSLPFHAPGKPLTSSQRVSQRLFVAGDAYAIPAQQGALKSGRLAAEMIIADQ